LLICAIGALLSFALTASAPVGAEASAHPGRAMAAAEAFPIVVRQIRVR